MTGRPGCQTMEMIGGSSVSYLARTPCVPLLSTLSDRGGNRRAFRLPGRAGIISIVRWNLRPVIFGVEKRTLRRSWISLGPHVRVQVFESLAVGS